MTTKKIKTAHKEIKILEPINKESEKVLKEIEKVPQESRWECFPPVGIVKLFQHHFAWWPRPIIHHCNCCCCCCDHGDHRSETDNLMIDLRLQQNTFGPGRAIHIVGVPAVIGAWRPQYFAEWFMEWNSSGGNGQLTVELQVRRPHSSTFQTLATGLGPNDNYLFSATRCGTYLFKAIVRDASGNRREDTAQVTAPAIGGIPC